MAEDKKSIIVYSDWMKKFEALTDEEAGRLIKHFFRYVNDLNPVAPDRITELSFIDIEQSLKRDLKKWEKRAERSRENGKNGGRPPASDNPEKPKETHQVILEPEKPDSVSVSVSVSGSVTDTVKEEDINIPAKAETVDFNRFILFFNSIAGRSFKVTDKVKTMLKARLKSYTKEELQRAIKQAHKDPYHIENNFKYLTPEFILRTEKLEMFLNQNVVEDKGSEKESTFARQKREAEESIKRQSYATN